MAFYKEIKEKGKPVRSKRIWTGVGSCFEFTSGSFLENEDNQPFRRGRAVIASEDILQVTRHLMSGEEVTKFFECEAINKLELRRTRIPFFSWSQQPREERLIWRHEPDTNRRLSLFSRD